jgi:uncharacterized protein (TIGR04255 family)
VFGDRRHHAATAEPPPFAIAEVVCGVVFEPLAELDVLVLGVFWDGIRERFPVRSLQPALVDHFEVSFGGSMQMRAVLASADGQFLLQIQHDRFFMNWRAKGAQYPRFSEGHGPDGLLVRMLREFEGLTNFVRERFGVVIRPKQVELTKVDMLTRGNAWNTPDELARVLPVTAAFGEAGSPEVNLRSVQRDERGTTIVHVVTVMKDAVPEAVRLETRHVAPAGDDLRKAFELANVELNRVFFKMVPFAADQFGERGTR